MRRSLRSSSNSGPFRFPGLPLAFWAALLAISTPLPSADAGDAEKPDADARTTNAPATPQPLLPPLAHVKKSDLATLPRLAIHFQSENPHLRLQSRRLARIAATQYYTRMAPPGLVLVPPQRWTFVGATMRPVGGFYLGRTEVSFAAFASFAKARGWDWPREADASLSDPRIRSPLDRAADGGAGGDRAGDNSAGDNSAGDNGAGDNGAGDAAPVDDPPPATPPAERNRQPATLLSLDQARAFAKSKECRLPTRAELWHAATAGGRRRYPWGDRFNPAHVHARESGAFGPTAVDEHISGASSDGVLNLLGNVAEWTETTVGKRNKRYLVVGGSFITYTKKRRFDTRRLSAGARAPDVGFRLARSLPKLPQRATPQNPNE